MTPKKLIGQISWHGIGDYDEVEIERAFFRDNGQFIVLDFVYDSRRHLIEMKRVSGNNFSGSTQQSTRKERWGIQASARLFSHGKSHILVGTWKEIDLFKFIIELEETDHFPDELPKA